jgi:cobalt-precorrin 5A hydrolase
VGVGFRKNANENDIMNAIEKAIEELGLSVGDIRVIATVEGKEGSAIVKVAETLRKPLLFVKKDDLNKMDLPETSAKRIGVKNVAEGCALFFAREKRLLLPKRVFGGVTIAIAR